MVGEGLGVFMLYKVYSKNHLLSNEQHNNEYFNLIPALLLKKYIVTIKIYAEYINCESVTGEWGYDERDEIEPRSGHPSRVVDQFKVQVINK